jgi:hypothetical protein
MAWKEKINDMTNNKAKAELTPDALPLGYVVKKEPKKARRTFAMQYSLLDALQKIADDKGTNLNALVNDVLTEYANNYLNED